MSDDTRDPWYPWYVADFRASLRVQKLTAAQKGIYRDLLDWTWMKGHIPDDVIVLADICDVSVALMQKHWPKLRKMFTPLPGLDGQLLVSARMESERRKKDSRREQKVAAGKASAAKRNAPPTDPQQRSTNRSDHIITKQLRTVEIFEADAAPPAPHGAARLEEGLTELMAKAARGEFPKAGPR